MSNNNHQYNNRSWSRPNYKGRNGNGNQKYWKQPSGQGGGNDRNNMESDMQRDRSNSRYSMSRNFRRRDDDDRGRNRSLDRRSNRSSDNRSRSLSKKRSDEGSTSRTESCSRDNSADRHNIKRFVDSSSSNAPWGHQWNNPTNTFDYYRSGSSQPNSYQAQNQNRRNQYDYQNQLPSEQLTGGSGDGGSDFTNENFFYCGGSNSNNSLDFGNNQIQQQQTVVGGQNLYIPEDVFNCNRDFSEPSHSRDLNHSRDLSTNVDLPGLGSPSDNFFESLAQVTPPSPPIISGLSQPCGSTSVGIVTSPTSKSDSSRVTKEVRENSAKQVVKKIMNEVSQMDKNSIKMVINDPKSKYDKALRAKAREKIRTELRKQLRSISLTDQTEYDKLHSILEPDEYVEQSDAYLEHIGQMLNINLLDNEFSDANENDQNNQLKENLNPDEIFYCAEKLLLQDTSMLEPNSNSRSGTPHPDENDYNFDDVVNEIGGTNEGAITKEGGEMIESNQINAVDECGIKNFDGRRENEEEEEDCVLIERHIETYSIGEGSSNNSLDFDDNDILLLQNLNAVCEGDDGVNNAGDENTLTKVALEHFESTQTATDPTNGNVSRLWRSPGERKLIEENTSCTSIMDVDKPVTIIEFHPLIHESVERMSAETGTEFQKISSENYETHNDDEEMPFVANDLLQEAQELMMKDAQETMNDNQVFVVAGREQNIVEDPLPILTESHKTSEETQEIIVNESQDISNPIEMNPTPNLEQPNTITANVPKVTPIIDEQPKTNTETECTTIENSVIEINMENVIDERSKSPPLKESEKQITNSIVPDSKSTSTVVVCNVGLDVDKEKLTAVEEIPEKIVQEKTAPVVKAAAKKQESNSNLFLDPVTLQRLKDLDDAILTCVQQKSEINKEINRLNHQRQNLDKTFMEYHKERIKLMNSLTSGVSKAAKRNKSAETASATVSLKKGNELNTAGKKQSAKKDTMPGESQTTSSSPTFTLDKKHHHHHHNSHDNNNPPEPTTRPDSKIKVKIINKTKEPKKRERSKHQKEENASKKRKLDKSPNPSSRGSSISTTTIRNATPTPSTTTNTPSTIATATATAAGATREKNIGSGSKNICNSTKNENQRKDSGNNKTSPATEKHKNHNRSQDKIPPKLLVTSPLPKVTSTPISKSTVPSTVSQSTVATPGTSKIEVVKKSESPLPARPDNSQVLEVQKKILANYSSIISRECKIVLKKIHADSSLFQSIGTKPKTIKLADVNGVGSDVNITTAIPVDTTPNTSNPASNPKPPSKKIVNNASNAVGGDSTIPATDKTVAALKIKNESDVIDLSNDDDSLNETTELPLKKFTGNIIGPKTTITFLRAVGRYLVAAGDDGNIYRFSLTTGKLEKMHKHHTKTMTGFYVEKNQFIYSISLDGTMKKYDIAHLQKRLLSRDFKEPLQSIDGEWGKLFVGSRVGGVFSYSPEEDKHENLCSVQRQVMAIRLCKEGPRKIVIVAPRASNIHIRDATDGLLLRFIEVPEKFTIYSMVLDNGIIHCGTNHKEIISYDFTNGTELYKMCGGSYAIGLHVMDNLIFSGCYDSHIYVHDKITGLCMGKFKGPGKKMLSSLDLVEDGTRIVASSNDKSVLVWNIPDFILQKRKTSVESSKNE